MSIIPNRLSIAVLLLLVGSMICGCERYPQDVENTLDKVSGDTLKAGITENPPYVILTDSMPRGVEVRLIKALAKELKAEVQWVQGSESTIMELLKQGQVHIAAGGLDKKSVWKKHLYLTRPHDTVIYSWGVPEGQELPEELKGHTVFVSKGSVAGSYAHKKGAKVKALDSLEWKEPVIAESLLNLRANNYQTSPKKLKEVQISLAITKGENAFVEKVEKFIRHYEKASQR